ncbi:MAG: O-antigen ligase family protein [Planctomycetota bacterium]|jgi:hypothetical protein
MAGTGDTQPAAPAESLAVVPRWIAVALVALAAFSGPLLFGAVERWAWAALWGVVAAAVVAAFVAWKMEGRAGIILAPVAFIAALFAAVALFQLVPLGAQAFAAVGGRTARVHGLLHGSRAHPVSLAPGGTFEAFLKATLVLMVSVIVLSIARTRAMLFTVVAAVAASAVIASAVGVIQEKPGRENIYWFRDLADAADAANGRSARLDPALSTGVAHAEAAGPVSGPVFFRATVTPGEVFGPYANSNHFAGLVEIATPVLFAFTLALLARRRGGWGEEGGFTGTPEGALVLLLCFAAVLSILAAFHAGSIGGLGGIAAGAVVVLFVMAVSRQVTKVTAVVVFAILAAAGAAALIYQGDLLSRIPAKLAERSEVWSTAWRGIRDLPIAGSGLGTYRYVAPHYGVSDGAWLHAHNDYLQLVFEVGVVLAAAVGLLALLQIRMLTRGALLRREPYCAALCAGALGAIAAIGFHSFFDFNLHVPANVVALSVIVSAASVARRCTPADIETATFPERVIASRPGRTTIAVVLCGAALLVVGLAVAAVAYADGTRRRTREYLAKADYAGGADLDARLEAALEGASDAASLLPMDAELAYQEANLLWLASNATDDEVRKSQLAAKSLRAAARAARLAPAYTFHELTAVTLGGAGEHNVERWQMPSVAYKWELARMLFDEGRDDGGFQLTREAIALESAQAPSDTKRGDAIVGGLLARFGTYERISTAVPDTFGGHLLFARGLAAAEITSAATDEYEKAAALAGNATRRGGFRERTALEVGGVLSRGRKSESAERMYDAALARNPGWAYLRLEYARLLAGSGRRDEALRQLDLILSGAVSKDLARDALDLKKSLQR